MLSYRRSDSAAIVGRIYDRLAARYGEDAVFLDIGDIPAGVDFRDHIAHTLARADAVVAVVGPGWTGARAGAARIGDADDPVRVEIESALSAAIPIVPVLVGGARMPEAAEMPASLARFPYLNALAVDAGADFDHHVRLLIAALDTILGPKAPPPPVPPSAPLALRLREYAAFALAVLLPLGAAAIGIAPPWPPGLWVATALGGAAIIAALRTRLGAAGPAALTRARTAAVVLLVASASAYLLANSVYVYTAPSNVRLAKGFVCTPEARLVFKDKCPSLGLDELRGAEFEAERLWTAPSIAIVRVALVVLWSVAFVALAVLVALASTGVRASGARL